MRDRFIFRCWQCKDTFDLTTEITAGQVLAFSCPFCGAELVFDPAPYQKPVTGASRGTEGGDRLELVLPDILPTAPPDASRSE